MATDAELRIQPPAEILAAARPWLDPVRKVMNDEFLSAYLTGSVLTQGFDVRKSRVNALLIARELEIGTLDRLRDAIPTPPRTTPRFEPLFLTRTQIERSLDSFPIEWLEVKERHLLLEGDDVLAEIEVPQTYLR